MSDLMNTTLPLAGVTGLLEEITASTFNGEIRTDRETGQPIWKCGLSARIGGLRRRVSLDVLTVGEPPSVPIDSEVVLIEPTVTFWVLKNGKAGVTVRARDIVLASEQPPVAASTPAEPAERRLPSKPQAGEGK